MRCKKIIKYLLVIIIALLCFYDIKAAEMYSSLTRGKQEELITDATLAAAAYKGGKIPTGYRSATKEEFAQYIGHVSDIKYNSATGHFQSESWWTNGLDGALLINEETGEIVLSFGGTEDLSDFGIDVEQAIGGIPIQYRDASVMLEHLITNTNLTQKIKVVGHSLGGGLATYATLLNDSSRVTTTTFNSAGLTVATNFPGIGNRNTSSITNVCNGGDAVSKYGKLYGTTYLVANDDFGIIPKHDTWWGTILGAISGYDAVAAAIATITESGLSHSIATLIIDMRLQLNKDDPRDLNNVSPDDKSGDDNQGSSDDIIDGGIGSGDSNVENGDSVTNGGEASSNGVSPNGDDTSTPDDSSSDSGGNASGDETSFSEEVNRDDDGEVEGNSSFSEAIRNLANSALDKAAIVGSTIPHKRILWIFSGESLLDSAGAVIKNITSKWNELTDDVEYKSQKSLFEKNIKESLP